MTDEAEATNDSAAVHKIAQIFDGVSGSYDQAGVSLFEPIAEALKYAIAPRAGESLLDVGCGRGRVLLAIAPEVGEGSLVHGIDISEGMLAEARTVLDEAGLEWVTLGVDDGSNPHLPGDALDIVTASMALFFIPRPGDALRSWHGLLKAGGRMGITYFGTRDPRWAEVDDAFAPYLPPDMKDARTSGTRGPFADEQSMCELLQATGFQSPEFTNLDLDVVFDDVDHWHRWTHTTGQSAMWAHVPLKARASVIGRAQDVFKHCVGTDGKIHLGQQIKVLVARTCAPGGAR